jgi:hypothetical protein
VSAEARQVVRERATYRFGVTRAVLLLCAEISNEKHGYAIWLRQSDIAGELGCGRQAVNKAVLQLIEDGWLRVDRKGAYGRSNRYVFTVPVVATSDSYQVSPETTTTPNVKATTRAPQATLAVAPEATPTTKQELHNQPSALDHTTVAADNNGGEEHNLDGDNQQIVDYIVSTHKWKPARQHLVEAAFRDGLNLIANGSALTVDDMWEALAELPDDCSPAAIAQVIHRTAAKLDNQPAARTVAA